MTAAFPCTQCGACCKSVQLSVETAGLDRGDGTCKHYDEAARSCTIYAARPEVCNVSAMYEKHFQTHYTWPGFVELNLRACRALYDSVYPPGSSATVDGPPPEKPGSQIAALQG